MQIDKITIYRVCNPIKHPYVTAFGSQSAFNSVVVKLESDGICGWDNPGLDVAPNFAVLEKYKQEEFSLA